ncbi:MAG: TraR/DksA family transcriptional regulator [bacterium]|nr:TraR/DksA family transcriptional regulator [bacterium]
MEQVQLDEFKNKLSDLKVEIEKELSSVADKDIGDHVPGEWAAKFPNFGDDNYLDAGSDSPDEVQAYEVNVSITGQLEDYLKKVEAALERIEDGTYGMDIKTGEPISVERLQVNPAAETAIPKP